MTEVQGRRVGETGIAVSVHGPEGVLDLVVPDGATSLDLAREYAAQAGLTGIPLLQTALGELLTADRSLAEAGVESGDVVVATVGVHRPRRRRLLGVRPGESDQPAVGAGLATLAAAAAVLAGWYAALTPDDLWRAVSIAVLGVVALAGCLPVGRHRAARAASAPAFGAAAAFAVFYEPGPVSLLTAVGLAAIAAAVVAAVGRTLGAGPDEPAIVWIAAGGLLFAVAGSTALLEWSPQVPWSLLLLLAMLAARFVPALAVEVPDDALLDLQRLAVTAWSARDRATGRRGRMVVQRSAMADLVARASRTVTAASAAVLLTATLAAPMVLATTTIDVDHLGARCLAFFAGATLLLTARSYRHRAARALLRAAGLVCWVALLADLAPDLASGSAVALVATALGLGAITVMVAVAAGRGWRSVWWSRRAEVAEGLCGSFAFGACVVAAGVFRGLWEITS